MSRVNTLAFQIQRRHPDWTWAACVTHAVDQIDEYERDAHDEAFADHQANNEEND